MDPALLQAIVSGTRGVSLTITAADLKEVVQAIFMQESERAAAAVEASKEVPTLTRAEAARMLNVSNSTLWRWNKDGYLKPQKIGSKTLYRKSDVDRLLQMDFGKGGQP